MCIFAFGLFDKLKNKFFSSFSYFAKKVSGHDICCVPFSESACKTENNDTKYDIEFRISSIRKMPWTTQSLNLASDVEVWCAVRPCQHWDREPQKWRPFCGPFCPVKFKTTATWAKIWQSLLISVGWSIINTSRTIFMLLVLWFGVFFIEKSSRESVEA